MPAGQAGENRNFAAGIAAVHIVAGILRLGIAELLGDFERSFKAHVLPLHLGQHEVRGAVDDAADLADVVGGQALVHRGNDGCAAADTGLKQEGRVVRFGKGQQLRAVGSDHFLIRSADAAAALQTLAHIRIGESGAADGLDHDFDLGVVQNRVDGVGKKCGVRGGGEIPHIQDVFDLDRLTDAAGDGCRVAAADLQHAGTDRAEAHDSNFSHWNFPLYSYTRYLSVKPPCRGRAYPAAKRSYAPR